MDAWYVVMCGIRVIGPYLANTVQNEQISTDKNYVYRVV